MKINGIRKRWYFHHYFPDDGAPGLRLYNLAVGLSLLMVGVSWTSGLSPHARSLGFTRAMHVWVHLPFVSLMLEWRAR